MTALSLPGVGITSGADLSPCRRYRYVLWRSWDPSRPVLTFLMLNPSTAEESEDSDDRTTSKVCRIASGCGYGGIRIVNLFAFRSRDPEALLTVDDPIGPRNDEVIVREVEQRRRIVCAWGSHHGDVRAAIKIRAVQVMKLLQWAETFALTVTHDGEPGHPLFLRDDVRPETWPEGETNAHDEATR